MKSAFIVSGPLTKDLEDNYYGIALNNEYFSRYLNFSDEMQIGVRVTQNNADYKKLSKLVLENITITELPNLSSLKGILFNRFKAKKIINRLVYESDATFVRCPGFFGIYAVRAAKKHKKPYLVELAGCPWDSLWNHSWKGKFVAPFMYFATRKVLKEAPYVLYVTNEFLQKRYPTNGINIGCSDVALNEFDESILEKRNQKIMKANNELVLGTTGAIDVAYKGQDLVIKAIAQLNRQGYKFKYRLVGGGDKARLQSIAEKYGVADEVIFEGAIPHQKVFNYLDEIDIYIQPSYTEGMPRALIEAMSRGCPCIGSNAGGIPELLDKEYIFTRGKFERIVPILAGFNKEKMLKQASRNYEFSKRFDKKVLDTRRNEFFQGFSRSVKNDKDKSI